MYIFKSDWELVLRCKYIRILFSVGYRLWYLNMKFGCVGCGDGCVGDYWGWILRDFRIWGVNWGDRFCGFFMIKVFLYSNESRLVEVLIDNIDDVEEKEW